MRCLIPVFVTSDAGLTWRNLADITGVIGYVYLDEDGIDPVEAADVNDDGKINLGDITRIVANVYVDKTPLFCT